MASSAVRAKTNALPALTTGKRTSTTTTVDVVIDSLISDFGKAKQAFEKKVQALGGAPGKPTGEVERGEGPAGGYKRKYQNGVLYSLPPAGPCWVFGSILDHYQALGGEAGFLGYPVTDEKATPGGNGRYNHFQGGSIYWTYDTGAREVHGAIRDKWASLGWEKSLLGYPKSDEKAFTEDGRVSEFQNGSIYWWPDGGAYEMGRIVLRYKGLYCFGETDEGSAADEPYVTMGVTAVPEIAGSVPGLAVRSQIYDDVDAGNERPDDMELYRGDPHGVLLAIALCEHDEGDPDKYLALVKQGVDLAGKGVAQGCGALLGIEAAPVCEQIWKTSAPLITSTINDLLGTEDDLIGKASMLFTAKEMITTARNAPLHFWGISYQRESELLSDGEASYKVYFSVEPA